MMKKIITIILALCLMGIGLCGCRRNNNEKDLFIKGMDVSSVIAEEASGVRYFNASGVEQDVFEILADAGVNYVRVRIWNNPYDDSGNGYGGGNCDIAKAAEIGRRAAEHGMKLLVDFHYSDFWADPLKQQAPKAWASLSLSEKQEKIFDYTVESLNTIKAAGADIGMVQIGNEINGGLAGVTDNASVMALLDNASKAVRAFSEDILIVVHYTDVNKKESLLWHAEQLKEHSIDYDVFGISYYPYWHGEISDMTATLFEISEKYGKRTCILETAYAYTLADGDSYGNTFGANDQVYGYEASKDGQKKYVTDILNAAKTTGTLGVFYWEGTWIPVGSDYFSNLDKWEKYGSGWASSFSLEYGYEYSGGCAWDNQAVFDHNGKALPALEAFNME